MIESNALVEVAGRIISLVRAITTAQRTTTCQEHWPGVCLCVCGGENREREMGTEIDIIFFATERGRYTELQ